MLYVEMDHPCEAWKHLVQVAVPLLAVAPPREPFHWSPLWRVRRKIDADRRRRRAEAEVTADSLTVDGCCVIQPRWWLIDRSTWVQVGWCAEHGVVVFYGPRWLAELVVAQEAPLTAAGLADTQRQE